MTKDMLARLFFVFFLVVVCFAQSQPNSIKADVSTEPPCSDTLIQWYLSHLPDVKTGEDTSGIPEVRRLVFSKLCGTCAMVAPYDTVIRRLLIQFLLMDKYSDVRAEAASSFFLLNRAKDYKHDPEITNALTRAMRQDTSAVVRLEAAHTLLSFCHRDTSEVLDTMISIATMRISEPLSSPGPKLKRRCTNCLSHLSKLRRGAVIGLAAKEFDGNEKAIHTLNALSADSDTIISKAANDALTRIQKRQTKGGK